MLIYFSVCVQVLNKSPSLPELLLGDRYRIEHVIGNLVSNAIKFSPEETEIVVDVSVENDTSNDILSSPNIFFWIV